MMKDLGIVRRLDALGRVVIPREYRKMNRIEVGDPLEIRALEGGDILVRKVDLSTRLKSIGEMALDSLELDSGKTAGVCSPSEWLLFSDSKRAAGDELDSRTASVVAKGERTSFDCDGKKAELYPVAGDTGVFGALVLFAETEVTEAENKLMETVARFMGKSMQNF